MSNQELRHREFERQVPKGRVGETIYNTIRCGRTEHVLLTGGVDILWDDSFYITSATRDVGLSTRPLELRLLEECLVDPRTVTTRLAAKLDVRCVQMFRDGQETVITRPCWNSYSGDVALTLDVREGGILIYGRNTAAGHRDRLAVTRIPRGIFHAFVDCAYEVLADENTARRRRVQAPSPIY